MKGKSRYGLSTGFPCNLTGNQCKTLVELVTKERLSLRAAGKRFDVSPTTVTMVLAMHRNGNEFATVAAH